MTLLVIVVVALLAVVGYQYFTRTAAQKASQGTGLSAFARIAEADGKIIAAKTTTAVQLEAAKAIHFAQDEVHKLLG
jgi:predicted negative regulator of RcsB-dependent stress response